MTMRLTQKQAKYIRRLFRLHEKIGATIADLTLAIAADEEQEVKKLHKQLLSLTVEIRIKIEDDYDRLPKETPGPKKTRFSELSSGGKQPSRAGKGD